MFVVQRPSIRLVGSGTVLISFYLLTCLELYEGVQSQPDSLLESRKAWQKGIARAPSYEFYRTTMNDYIPGFDS